MEEGVPPPLLSLPNARLYLEHSLAMCYKNVGWYKFGTLSVVDHDQIQKHHSNKTYVRIPWVCDEYKQLQYYEEKEKIYKRTTLYSSSS